MAVNMRTMLNALETGGKTLFLASSSEIHAPSVERNHAVIPTPEHTLLSIDDIAPRWSCAANKIAGESAVSVAAKQGKFTPIVVRVQIVHEPRMGPTHVIPAFLLRAKTRTDPLPVYGSY